jgi:hypothetical protein
MVWLVQNCRSNKLGYMTKTLNQIILFCLQQNQNIFFSNIGNQNIFLEKNHTQGRIQDLGLGEIRALRDKNNEYSNSRVVRIFFFKRNKKPYPPFKLSGRSLSKIVTTMIIK